MKNIFSSYGRFIPLAVLALIGMILIPLPALLLDILAILVIIFSFLIIYRSISTKRSMDFSLLPSCLLILTLLNLVIQVSFTRLILTQGESFKGMIIRLITSILTISGGTAGLITCLIIYASLTFAIGYFLVRGVVRAGEVAARFYIDALPGRLMAIEAEYNSGKITEEEANIRKENLQKELDFYGALDGAGKFISGNFKASIIITFLCIFGGFIICIAANGIIFSSETLENGNFFIIMTISTGSLKSLVLGYIPFSIANGLLSIFFVLIACMTMSLHSSKFK